MERSQYVWLCILILGLVGYSVYIARVVDPKTEEASRQYEECVKAETGLSVEEYRLENNEDYLCQKTK